MARVRPVTAEPYPSLPTVRCPGCAAVATRTQHPFQRWPRDAVRIIWAVTLMGVHLLVGALLIFGTGAIAGDWLTDGAPWSRGWPPAAIDLVGPVFLGLATGAWLVAGLGHHPLWRVLLGWAVLLPMLLVAIFCLHQGTLLVAARMTGTPLYDVLDGHGPFNSLDRFSELLMMTLAAIAFGVLGVPLGFLLRAMGRANRRIRWRRRRRRRRRSF